MAIQDPISVTVSGTAIPLARVYTGSSKSLFVSADGKTLIEVNPSTNGKTTRRNIRLYQKKVVTDPLVGTTNVWRGSSWVFSNVRDADGYTDADAVAEFTGLVAALAASSNALLLKVLAGEN